VEATAKAHTARTRLSGIRSSARYGRLRARGPRFAFLALVLILCLAGLRAIVAPAGGGTLSDPVGPPPDYAEQSFAVAFTRAYLSYDSARPQVREEALATFAAAGFELGTGYSPPDSGSRSVEWAEVAQVQRPLAGGVSITVAAKPSDSTELYLSVPVDRDPGGAIYLADYPSFVGPPLSSSKSPGNQGGEPVDDEELSALVHRALGNYLAGDAENLAADLAHAATVTLPTNQLRLEAVDQLNWVSGSGGGAVLATVSASDPQGSAYTLRYEVGVRRGEATDPQLGPGWRVTYVQAISQQS